jgi:SAM-dependent methyltransferase
MTMNTNIECELCHSITEEKAIGVPGYQKGMSFNIHCCPSCDTSFSMPRVDAADIYEAIYQNGDRVPGYARYWSYSKNIKEVNDPLGFLAKQEEAYWGIKTSLNKLLDDEKNAKILEIGSGLGYLTYALYKSGYDITGIDISSKAVEQAKRNFGDFYIACDLFDYANKKPGSYDVIILTEVIEHITNPMEFIETALKLLKSKGAIVITTPNKSIYPDDIVWETESPPIHQWWFSENSFEYMRNQFGLKMSLINFREFYSRNPKVLRLNKIRATKFSAPILEESGALVQEYSLSAKSGLQKTLNRIKVRFRIFLSYFRNDLIVCREKGVAMCAILEKKID